MAVGGSPSDVDQSLGEWRGKIHLLPVYVNFDYNANINEVYPEQYPTSGAGLKPSHYQARIQSLYHKNLVEVFLTYMPKLHRIVESKGISLP